MPGQNRGRSRNTVFESGLVYGRLFAFAMLALIFSPVCTSAQDNYEIQVYGYDLVEPEHTMVELHSNFTIDGSKDLPTACIPRITRSTRQSRSPTALTTGSSVAFTSSLRSPKARDGSGWEIIFVRALPFRRNGTGPSASVSRMKSATSGGNIPLTHGPGKSVPSWTRNWPMVLVPEPYA